MQESSYDKEFYQSQMQTSYESAREIVPLLKEVCGGGLRDSKRD